MKRDWRPARTKVDREGCCRVCDSIFDLEAAHVVPRSLGGGMEEDDIVPLCRTCHKSYDAHELDLIPYLTKVEQAHAVSILGLGRAMERLGGKVLA